MLLATALFLPLFEFLFLRPKFYLRFASRMANINNPYPSIAKPAQARLGRQARHHSPSPFQIFDIAGRSAKTDCFFQGIDFWCCCVFWFLFCASASCSSSSFRCPFPRSPRSFLLFHGVGFSHAGIMGLTNCSRNKKQEDPKESPAP